jgi:hypothetical protein
MEWQLMGDLVAHDSNEQYSRKNVCKEADMYQHVPGAGEPT